MATAQAPEPAKEPSSDDKPSEHEDRRVSLAGLDPLRALKALLHTDPRKR